MNFYEPRNHFVQLKAEWDNFRERRYPSFVTERLTGFAPPGIPVFSFHDVTPDKFERQLEYLWKNSYETVTADEYLARVDRTRGDRVVMLTFDDGRASLYTAAYPLLKSYGMKAVAFICPGEVKDAEAPRETPDGGPLCAWPELAAMRDAVDIQSHSLLHWIMFVSPKLAGFYSPDIRDGWIGIDRPITREGGADRIERDYPLGTPFYEMDSRLSDKLRVVEPALPREICAKFVEDNGGEEFFKQRGWREKLASVHGNAVVGQEFVTETEEERAENILRCLADSKKIIESRLPGHEARHICFPFTIGGKTAVRMAEQAGYATMSWGVAEPAHARDAHIRSVTRIKDDYIFRLPGEGRWPLRKVFSSKFWRRFGIGK